MKRPKFSKKRIVLLLTITSLIGVLFAPSAYSYFLDKGMSTGNVLAAGSLDLLVDGTDANVVKFSVSNMAPGNQPKTTYNLTNIGTLTGYLDIENINMTDNENTRIGPEILAGDTTDGVGELSSVLGCNIFIDYGGDGWFSTGDVTIYNAITSGLPTNFELDEPIAPGTSVYITVIFNWWSTANDNQAMTDSIDLDVSFELAQTTGQ